MGSKSSRLVRSESKSETKDSVTRRAIAHSFPEVYIAKDDAFGTLAGSQIIVPVTSVTEFVEYFSSVLSMSPRDTRDRLVVHAAGLGQAGITFEDTHAVEREWTRLRAMHLPGSIRVSLRKPGVGRKKRNLGIAGGEDPSPAAPAPPQKPTGEKGLPEPTGEDESKGEEEKKEECTLCNDDPEDTRPPDHRVGETERVRHALNQTLNMTVKYAETCSDWSPAEMYAFIRFGRSEWSGDFVWSLPHKGFASISALRNVMVVMKLWKGDWDAVRAFARPHLILTRTSGVAARLVARIIGAVWGPMPIAYSVRPFQNIMKDVKTFLILHARSEKLTPYEITCQYHRLVNELRDYFLDVKMSLLAALLAQAFRMESPAAVYHVLSISPLVRCDIPSLIMDTEKMCWDSSIVKAFIARSQPGATIARWPSCKFQKNAVLFMKRSVLKQLFTKLMIPKGLGATAKLYLTGKVFLAAHALGTNKFQGARDIEKRDWWILNEALWCQRVEPTSFAEIGKAFVNFAAPKFDEDSELYMKLCDSDTEDNADASMLRSIVSVFLATQARYHSVPFYFFRLIPFNFTPKLLDAIPENVAEFFQTYLEPSVWRDETPDHLPMIIKFVASAFQAKSCPISTLRSLIMKIRFFARKKNPELLDKRQFDFLYVSLTFGLRTLLKETPDLSPQKYSMIMQLFPVDEIQEARMVKTLPIIPAPHDAKQGLSVLMRMSGNADAVEDLLARFTPEKFTQWEKEDAEWAPKFVLNVLRPSHRPPMHLWDHLNLSAHLMFLIQDLLFDGGDPGRLMVTVEDFLEDYPSIERLRCLFTEFMNSSLIPPNKFALFVDMVMDVWSRRWGDEMPENVLLLRPIVRDVFHRIMCNPDNIHRFPDLVPALAKAFPKEITDEFLRFVWKFSMSGTGNIDLLDTLEDQSTSLQDVATLCLLVFDSIAQSSKPALIKEMLLPIGFPVFSKILREAYHDLDKPNVQSLERLVISHAHHPELALISHLSDEALVDRIGETAKDLLLESNIDTSFRSIQHLFQHNKLSNPDVTHAMGIIVRKLKSSAAFEDAISVASDLVIREESDDDEGLTLTPRTGLTPTTITVIQHQGSCWMWSLFTSLFGSWDSGVAPLMWAQCFEMVALAAPPVTSMKTVPHIWVPVNVTSRVWERFITDKNWLALFMTMFARNYFQDQAKFNLVLDALMKPGDSRDKLLIPLTRGKENLRNEAALEEVILKRDIQYVADGEFISNIAEFIKEFDIDGCLDVQRLDSGKDDLVLITTKSTLLVLNNGHIWSVIWNATKKCWVSKDSNKFPEDLPITGDVLLRELLDSFPGKDVVEAIVVSPKNTAFVPVAKRAQSLQPLAWMGDRETFMKNLSPRAQTLVQDSVFPLLRTNPILQRLVFGPEFETTSLM